MAWWTMSLRECPLYVVIALALWVGRISLTRTVFNTKKKKSCYKADSIKVLVGFTQGLLPFTPSMPFTFALTA